MEIDISRTKKLELRGRERQREREREIDAANVHFEGELRIGGESDPEGDLPSSAASGGCCSTGHLCVCSAFFFTDFCFQYFFALYCAGERK